MTALEERLHLRRRHGSHGIYLRPIEATKLYRILYDAVEIEGGDPDLERVLEKVWAVDWKADAEGCEV